MSWIALRSRYGSRPQHLRRRRVGGVRGAWPAAVDEAGRGILDLPSLDLGEPAEDRIRDDDEGRKPFDPTEMVMVARSVSFMFVWYGMLWSVIEALEKRNIVLRGPLGYDVARVRRSLKKCRNAVMHVPDDNSLLDIRIQKLVEQKGAVVRIRRVHHGLGRLLREEVQRQAALPSPLAQPGPEA